MGNEEIRCDADAKSQELQLLLPVQLPRSARRRLQDALQGSDDGCCLLNHPITRGPERQAEEEEEDVQQVRRRSTRAAHTARHCCPATL